MARYTGLFFYREDIERVAAKYGKALSKPIEVPHIMLQYRPNSEQKKIFQKLLGQKVSVVIDAYGNDGINEGFRVSKIHTKGPETEKSSRK